MQMRNLKDFLLVYNAMSEHCFTHCVSNLNVRSLTADEDSCVSRCAGRGESCVSRCAGRGVRTAHRVMTSYLTMMPEIVERRSEEQRRALSDAAAIGDDPTGVTASAGVAGVTEGVAGVTEGVAEGVADGVAGVTAVTGASIGVTRVTGACTRVDRGSPYRFRRRPGTSTDDTRVTGTSAGVTGASIGVTRVTGACTGVDRGSPYRFRSRPGTSTGPGTDLTGIDHLSLADVPGTGGGGLGRLSPEPCVVALGQVRAPCLAQSGDGARQRGGRHDAAPQPAGQLRAVGAVPVIQQQHRRIVTTMTHRTAW
ncbi:unnamed protein product [Lampetra fluviatilis]